MTGRAFVLLLIAASTLYAANNVGVGWLYALGYALGLSVGVSAAVGWWSLAGLRLEVTAAPRAEAGQQLEATVTLVNTRRHARRMIAVMAPPLGERGRLWPWRRALLPAGWKAVLVPALGPGERRTIPLAVPAPKRGLFAPPEIHLQAAPLGLVAWSRRMRPAESAARDREAVAIHPRLHAVPAPQDAAARGGEGAAALTGASSRGELIKSVRPYRSGDETRLIHWRKSARAGRLTVKEREGDDQVRMLALTLEPAQDGDVLEAQLSEAASQLVQAHERGWKASITGPDGASPWRQTLDAQLDWLAAWR